MTKDSERTRIIDGHAARFGGAARHRRRLARLEALEDMWRAS